MALALLPIVLLAASAVGSTNGQPSLTREVHAARVSTPISIDGVLSEELWHNGNAVTEFWQRDPYEGAPSSQRTEVRVAYDDDAVYVGARLYDSAPDSIIARLTRRDVSIPADRFSLYLDPFYDRRSGYYFMVNAAGTLYDGTLSNDGWEDNSWDGVWEGKARIDREGWTCEMRIPYSQLRFQKSQRYRWGVNFRRVIQRRNEETFLVYQPKKESGFVSRFPDLVGMENVSPGRSLEVLPYLTTKAEYIQHNPLDPFNDGSRYTPDGGADVRMGVGSRLTLNATINPDFGQVEIDPAEVNLSDAETFFQEKRPFFVEGSSNFGCGNQGANDYWGFNWPEPIFFYTRRIGRNPQIDTPGDSDFENAPVGTSILGAAKLTGKIAPTVNFGTLHAITAREHADLQYGSGREEYEIEPLAYYGVTRALKEFKGRHHGLGFMTTAAARSFEDQPSRNWLNSESFMTAVDGWTFLDKDQTWVISGWSAMSHIRGTPTRIGNVQQNSRHYFQRPDANHVGVDPNRTSLTGFGSRYWLNKQKGSTFGNAAIGFMDPNFDVNDVGFHSRSDVINAHAGYGYQWTETTKLRKYQNVLGALFASFDFQGNPTWGGVFLQGNTEFFNNWSWRYRTAFNPTTVNTTRTRGGPRTLNRPGYELGTYFDTDGKAKVFYWVDYNTYFTEAGSWNFNLASGIEWKPVSNLTLAFEPRLFKVHEDVKWLLSEADPAADATFGRREVFSQLDRTDVRGGVRFNCAFTPRLSLQLYGEPLISSGHYHGFKQLARPKSYDFIDYAAQGGTYDQSTGMIDPDGPGGPAAPFAAYNPDFDYSGNPDFKIRSLRGNAVLRWEYMPGSTLFLVWTQERGEFDAHRGEFQFGPAFGDLFDLRADNIFLAKMTYYFTL